MRPLSLVKNHFYFLVAILLFALTFTAYYFTGEGGATPFHYFVPLADAFLHVNLWGVLWISKSVGKILRVCFLIFNS